MENRVNPFADGAVIAPPPAVVADTPTVPIAWVCGYASVPEGVRTAGEADTSLPPYHLPIECR